ncbi:Glutathione S-transferase 1 [Aphelenchoides bicaudatus]|nr:Glutathione S-transferase 1 [Aphelenchoides bicaudatus]
MNFKAPHFVLFESSSDPFSGIIDRLFKHGGYPFERVEVQSTEEAKQMGLPLAKLPALQFDNVTISGFSPICRSIASRTGLDGTTLNESSEIDMIVNFIEQVMERIRIVLCCDEPKEHEVMEEINQFLDKLAPFLDARFKDNNGSKTIVGKVLTWGDFVTVYFLRMLVDYFDDDFSTMLQARFPHLLEYFDKNQNL